MILMSKRDKFLVVGWLLTGAIMVAAMVIIGGTTRLTHSGLSMTDWKLIMGMIPPMNEAEWLTAFEQYKQFPEFKLVNSHYTLEDFKSIFFWEWLHRFIGRMIGIVFFFPFVFFLIKKKLSRKVILQCLVLFGLGALQGFLGWFMVKSGLIDKPNVSHYRLAIHLAAAFTTFSYILWVVFGIVLQRRNIRANRSKGVYRLSNIVLLLISVQIIFGAFVAGLKAGYIYPEWPLMAGEFMPRQVAESIGNSGISSLFNEMVSVQFVHRTFAYLVVLLILILWIQVRKQKLPSLNRRGPFLLLILVFIQFILGVYTLLTGVQIHIAVTHQFVALLLLAASVYSIFTLRTRSSFA